MTTAPASSGAAVVLFYAQQPGDVPFRRLLQSVPCESDSQLADVIDADGRWRIDHHLPVTLARYIQAVPDLVSRTDSLDAAIDMALRAAGDTSTSIEDRVEKLVAQHPELEHAIREAAALSQAVWSTNRLQSRVSGKGRELPCPFGPRLPDGRQRYTLTSFLGEGAFGQVYLAEDLHLSEPDHAARVSIKIRVDRDTDLRERDRFADEASKARRIDHPNVVRVIDRGLTEDDEDYIVYEYVEGGDLARFLKDRGGKLPPADAARLMQHVARGVHAAHMAGLVHRDLKPSNIVMTADAEPRVADFGIAVRPGERPEPVATDQPVPVGNLAFMSPEQFRHDPAGFNIPTDVYALGGMLYWLLTGALPHGANPEEIARFHDVQREPASAPSPRTLVPKVDVALDAICRRALANAPTLRHASAAEFADDLAAWLSYRPIAWQAPSMWRRLKLWIRRQPVLAIALAVACMAVPFVVSQWTGKQWAQQQLAAENQIRNEFATQLKNEVRALDRAVDEGLYDEVFTNLWGVEWIFGPTVMTDGATRREIWRVRTHGIRELLDRKQQAGQAESIEYAMFETALGYWLVEDKQYSPALEVLRTNRERFARLVPAHDPWLVHVDALIAAAELGQSPPPAKDQLADIRRRLEASDILLHQANPSASLHALVLRALETLFEKHLDDKPALDAVRARMATDIPRAVERARIRSHGAVQQP